MFQCFIVLFYGSSKFFSFIQLQCTSFPNFFFQYLKKNYSCNPGLWVQWSKINLGKLIRLPCNKITFWANFVCLMNQTTYLHTYISYLDRFSYPYACIFSHDTKENIANLGIKFTVTAKTTRSTFHL